MLFVWHSKILHKHCFQFLLGVKMAPRETENNAYAKFWGDKQRALWYVIVFSEVVNLAQPISKWSMHNQRKLQALLCYQLKRFFHLCYINRRAHWGVQIKRLRTEFPFWVSSFIFRLLLKVVNYTIKCIKIFFFVWFRN